MAETGSVSPGRWAGAVRAAEASGPRWDLINALSGGGNCSQCLEWNCSSKDMLAACCQPNLGPLGSGCDSRRGGDSDISLHEGVSNPASFSARSQLLTAWKHGTWSWAMPSMIVSATTGCLSLIIFKQSAQLDQYAATLDLTADVSPSPPKERGKLAVIFAVSSACGAPRMARRHAHTAAS